MIVSEIASGSPLGATFADDKVFLLVEAEQEEVVNDTITQIAEHVKNTKKPTLSDLNRIVDSLRIPSRTTLILAYQENDLIHFLLRGKGAVLLKRGGQSAALLSGTGSASGPIQARDTFILAGPSFLSVITLSVFTILMGKSSAEDVEQHIVTYIEQNSEADSLCLLLQQSEEEAEEHTPIIHEVPPPPINRQRLQLPTFNPFSSVTNRFSSLSPHTKQQRMTLLVGCVMLFLLVASLIFGSTQRHKIATAQQLEEVTSMVNKDLAEAEKLVELSPEQAAPLLSHAHDLLIQAQNDFPEESQERATLNTLLEKTELLSQQAKQIYTVTPEIFFNITWVKEGGKGDKIALAENAFFVTDPSNKSIYKIGLPQKKAEIIGVNDVFTQSSAITTHQNNPYISISGSDPRVTNNRADTAIPRGDNWGQIADIASFGGNIYLLDTIKAIWKHPGSGEDFGNGTNWLSDELAIDFQSVQSLAVDGSIWVLKPDEIIKLTMGSVDPFFLKGDTLRTGKQIWTSEDTKYLYVLEESRIVVFDKEGNYEKQYVWDNFPDVTDFTVAESLNKLLLVKGDQVLSIDLVQ